MAKEQKDFGLIAIVAIVAIVGMVVLILGAKAPSSRMMDTSDMPMMDDTGNTAGQALKACTKTTEEKLGTKNELLTRTCVDCGTGKWCSSWSAAK